MPLQFKIKDYRIDPEDETKTYVGFQIVDNEDGSVFIIDKKVTTGSKTQNEILTEAKQMSQAEIDEWQGGIKDIGKTWDPETGLLEHK